MLFMRQLRIGCACIVLTNTSHPGNRANGNASDRTIWQPWIISTHSGVDWGLLRAGYIGGRGGFCLTGVRWGRRCFCLCGLLWWICVRWGRRCFCLCGLLWWICVRWWSCRLRCLRRFGRCSRGVLCYTQGYCVGKSKKKKNMIENMYKLKMYGKLSQYLALDSTNAASSKAHVLIISQ